MLLLFFENHKKCLSLFFSWRGCVGSQSIREDVKQSTMLKFEPILKSLIWGGEKLVPYKELTADCHAVGESWDLSGIAGEESVVAEGPDRGMHLAALVERDGAALVGRANYARFGNEFPLLVKFIDAREDLSVQVHPNDQLARACHNAHGKSEMWYVLRGSDEGAHLRLGFSRSVTPEEYEQAVEQGTIQELVAEYPIREGDLFHIPAGRIHTICAGAMLLEIQQPSTLTYRIYDYGRTDSNGRPRELHTELAKKALDFTVQESYRMAYEQAEDKAVRLVTSEHFTTDLLKLTQPYTLELAALDSFVALICTDGRGVLRDDRGQELPIHQGETVLIPASTQCVEILPESEKMTLLTSWIE